MKSLRPNDLRIPWFHGFMMCQTNKPKSGAEELMVVESDHKVQDLPVAFWLDYMECATVTNMPAHVLRIESNLKSLNAADSRMRGFFVDVANKRLESFDPNRKYESTDIWWATKNDSQIEMTGSACGLRLRTFENWPPENISIQKSKCVANYSSGPYRARSGSLSPEILVLVMPPDGNETLQDFAARFIKDAKTVPYQPVRCPASSCIAVEADRTGLYGKNGDGHGRIIVFERDQPDFPGVAFETPKQPELAKKEGMQYFRPSQTILRIPGKLFYLVLLDTAESIEDSAMKDFNFFLEHLEVE